MGIEGGGGTCRSLYDRRVPINNHVRIFQSLVKALGWKGADQDYGMSMPDLLASYDQKSQSWKMSEPSLFEDSTACLVRLPKSGMMRNGKIYALKMWERSTAENEYGSLPTLTIGTPTTSLTGRSRKFAENRLPNPAEYVQMFPTPRAGNPGSRPNKKGGKVLAEEVKKFPTPTVNGNYNRKGASATSGDGLGTIVKKFPTPRANSGNGCGYHGQGGKDLQTTVKELCSFPTPGTTGLSNGSGNCDKINKLYEQGIVSEEERRSMRSGNGGQLSADWVERLMGYPLGYTDIEKENVELDNDFPKAWLNNTWEESVPRIVFSVKNRINRLRCLGNAVVPQIPEMIWWSVKHYLNWE